MLQQQQYAAKRRPQPLSFAPFSSRDSIVVHISSGHNSSSSSSGSSGSGSGGSSGSGSGGSAVSRGWSFVSAIRQSALPISLTVRGLLQLVVLLACCSFALLLCAALCVWGRTLPSLSPPLHNSSAASTHPAAALVAAASVHSASTQAVRRRVAAEAEQAALGVGAEGGQEADAWSAPGERREAEEAEDGRSSLDAAVNRHASVAHLSLRWHANFTLHPGLFSSAPPGRSYSAALFDSLFAAHYVTPPIPRRSDSSKVVLLLKVRNRADVLLFFLQHHSAAVDSIVVMDDCSADHTLPLLSEYGAALKVEVVLSKRRWLRLSEWEDHNLLVQTARAVQATHFLHLDVDELISFNCVQPVDENSEPLLLSSMRLLDVEHEVLRVDGVELWGNAYQQRLGMTRQLTFAAYDQFSHLHPVPLVTADSSAMGITWPPSTLDSMSVYASPPAIQRGKRSVSQHRPQSAQCRATGLLCSTHTPLLTARLLSLSCGVLCCSRQLAQQRLSAGWSHSGRHSATSQTAH